MSLEKNLRRYEPEIGLAIAALLWAVTFPLIRLGVRDLHPLYFVAFRFSLATLSLLPVVFVRYFSARAPAEARREFRAAILSGTLLGALVSVAFISQTIGLQTISSPRSAFITGLYVVLVPLLSPVFTSKFPSRIEWLGAVAATLGLYFLVEPTTGGVASGDWWTLASAVSTAAQIHFLQIILRRQKFDPVLLAFFQVLGVAICAWSIVPWVETGLPTFSAGSVVSVLICGLVVSVGSLWLQATYQNRTTPVRASLIFSLEPVFATLFGFLILGETLSGKGLAGAGLILAALIFTEVWARRALTHQ